MSNICKTAGLNFSVCLRQSLVSLSWSWFFCLLGVLKPSAVVASFSKSSSELGKETTVKSWWPIKKKKCLNHKPSQDLSDFRSLSMIPCFDPGTYLFFYRMSYLPCVFVFIFSCSFFYCFLIHLLAVSQVFYVMYMQLIETSVMALDSSDTFLIIMFCVTGA